MNCLLIHFNRLLCYDYLLCISAYQFLFYHQHLHKVSHKLIGVVHLTPSLGTSLNELTLSCRKLTRAVRLEDAQTKNIKVKMQLKLYLKNYVR